MKRNRIVNYLKGISGEAVRYIIVGVCTTLVNIGLFALMTQAFEIGHTVSNVTSISVSILFAYVANKRIVFRNRCGSLSALALECVKFIGARLITLALEVAVVELLVRLARLKEMYAKLSALVFVVVANYFISKLLVFRSGAKAP